MCIREHLNIGQGEVGGSGIVFRIGIGLDKPVEELLMQSFIKFAFGTFYNLSCIWF